MNSFSGVARQRGRRGQEAAKKVTSAKGRRKRQLVQDQDSIEGDELSQSGMTGDLTFSEPEQLHIHRLTLDAVKVTIYL